MFPLKNLVTPASWGKERRVITRSKAHVAGNTSYGEDNTLLKIVASLWFLSVPGPNLKADLYKYWLLLIMGLNYTSSLNNLRTQHGRSSSTSIGSDARFSSRTQRLPAEFTTSMNSKGIGVIVGTLQAYQATTKRSQRKSRTLHQDAMALRFLAPIKIKEAKEYTFQLLFIRRKKPNLRVPGSSFQVPDPMLWVYGC
ncbi:hypothetical protein DY000_02031514 [Brassica cretica]|uniref:Uncharacterized protein n=1 Tax=Brassica cretica TaxID=69181 RepID=A0ABQ7DWG7_BRACR|nr:hypothetical protein DY000_02031514 [Brassica cretica]